MLQLHNVSKIYQMGDSLIKALDNVSMKITRGEFIAIRGVSGSGKSTLLHVLGGLDRPDKGTIIWDKKDLSKLSDKKLAEFRNQKIGFVFQQFHLLPKTSVLENVLLPTIYSGSLREWPQDSPDRSSEKPYQRALQILKKLNLSDRSSHTPAQLSGGQQQRVAIARALINNPQTILADEPTGNLDSKSGSQILKILEKLNKEDGLTIIVVSHDREIAKKAKRIIKMKDGRIIKDSEK